MDRKMLREDQWKRIEPLCSGKASERGGTGRDNRLFVEAVLWIARTGSPWRDLPPALRSVAHSVYALFPLEQERGLGADGRGTQA